MSRTYMRGVSDFLAAGRTAGRYLICVSQGIAALGAITIVADAEMYLHSGFAMQWWELAMSVVILLVTVSGWVVYRFRQTRALTMAQFFEMRYSRRFRIFAGTVCFLSGIVNYGIYPAVSARFFIYFCGLPPTLDVVGLQISTFVLLMIALLATALFFVFVGGQIAVILTDFVQGIFVGAVFVVITILLLLNFDHGTVAETLAERPPGSSYTNPFDTAYVEDFNFWFFLIGVMIFVYNMFSWQGTQGYNASASSAHEARMGQVLTNWRQLPQMMFLLLIGVCAYTVMNNPEFALTAEGIRDALSAEDNENVQSQLTVPMVLANFLPIGLMGAFAAVMLGAFITTNDTYLHSWGSIFVQDIIMPLRKKAFSPKQHILALRLSILGVAVFAFFFSLIFQQAEYIRLFFAITGAIFAGGAGAVIIGGLYWKRGTTRAAYAALITGAVLAVGGIVCDQVHKYWVDNKLPVEGVVKEFVAEVSDINGMVMTLIAMCSSIGIYAAFSLIGRRKDHDMDRLLHRGKYAVEADLAGVQGGAPASGDARATLDAPESVAARIVSGIKILFGVGRDFTRIDRWICRITYAWVLAWFVVFVIGTVWNLTSEVSDEAWMKYWYIFVTVRIGAAALVIVWFAIGGVRDIRRMFARLRTMDRDHADDGTVRKAE